MQSISRFLQIALIMLSFNCAVASNDYVSKPKVVNYTVSDYRAASLNSNVAEAASGMIYFGNADGLLEFDGISWQLYKNSNNTIIRSIDIDHTGNIYAGGQNEIGYFRHNAAGELTYYSYRDSLPLGLKAFSDIWGTFEHEGLLFYQTFEYVFVLKDGEWEVFEPEVQFTRSFMVDGRFLVMDREKGVKEYIDGKLELVEGTEFLSQHWLTFPFAHPALGLMYAAADFGVVRFKKGKMEIIDWEVGEYLKKYEVLCAFPLGTNALAFGTNKGGIVISNLEGEILQTLTRSDGLQNNTINWIYTNEASNLWVCLEQGVDFLEWNGAFRRFVQGDDLSGPGYACYADDETYYLGTNKGAYYADRRDGKDSEFRIIPGTENQIWNFTEINGEVFCGDNAGTFVLNRGGGYRIAGLEGGWDHLHLGKDTNKIVVGCYKGLALIEKRNGKWEFDRYIPGIEETLRVIEVDDQDGLWVSHPYKGVFHIELSAALDTVVNWSLLGKAHGLPQDINNTVFKLYGEVLVGTESGVYVYDHDMGKFKPHDEWNERLGVKGWVRRMKQTEKGAWFIMDGQLGLLELIEGEWKKTLFQRLPDPMIGNFEEFYVYEDETLLGTKIGFLHHVGKHVDNTPPVSFIRKAVLTRTDSTIVGGFVAPAHQKQSLDYAHNAIKFEYAGISPRGAKAAFRTRLVGYETEWTDWTTSTQRGFTNLKEGHYEFQLQAAVPGEDGGPIATFEFQVKPPWYRSILAYGLYAILAVGMVILLERWVKRRLEEQRLKLIEEAAKEKEAQQRELQLKEAEFKRQQLEKEKELVELRNQKLSTELEFQTKELGSTTMHIIQSNQLLENISENMREAFKQAENPEARKILRKLQQEIKLNFKNEDQWEQFELYFDKVHEDFLKRLKDQFPKITTNDLKLCAYLKMNLSTKEIAGLMNISVRGVESSRYRLRSKLELDTDVNLVEFIRSV